VFVVKLISRSTSLGKVTASQGAQIVIRRPNGKPQVLKREPNLDGLAARLKSCPSTKIFESYFSANSSSVPPSCRRRKHSRGFTLIELMIVISIILILVSVALPAYNQSIARARESVLKQNLFTLRSVISQYTLDKQKAPQSLDDLVTAGYLKQLPMDPTTGKNDTWVPDQEDNTVMSIDEQDQGGIIDVHSGSSGVGSDGTPYNTW
jgi:general secretion pathway protein G